MKSILFILQYDSFINTLIPVINLINESKHSYKIILYKKFLKKNWITNEIIKLLGNIKFLIGGKRKVYLEINKEYDIVVFGTVGNRDLSNFLEHIKNQRLNSKIVTGYAGALLDNYPDKFLNGVKRRSQSDLIWVPGNTSKQQILETKMITDESIIKVTGLPRFDELYRLSKKWNRFDKSIILFIEQPTFPESKLERIQLIKYMCELASSFPNHKLVIKPRFLLKAGHAHRPKYLLPDLINEIDSVPKNIEISKNNLYDLFPNTDFAFTISSTGGLESLLVGIPTYFIKDFCNKNNLYGTNYFNSIGSVTSIKKMIKKQFPKINYHEAKKLIRFEGNNTKILTEALLNL